MHHSRHREAVAIVDVIQVGEGRPRREADVFGRQGPRGVRRGEGQGTLDRPATKDDALHLRRFAAEHGGVEAYLEPATTVTGTTVVLVAASGEWTRRRVGDPAHARALARKLSVPLYDVALTGYPARMRAWTEARHGAERCRTPGLRGGTTG